MSDFCRQHAFYDCPVCRGESLDWIIPIVKDADVFGRGGEVTGLVTVTPDNVVTITGTPDLPMPPQTFIVREPELPVVSEREHSPVRDRDPRPGPSRSETPVPRDTRLATPRQAAEIAALFSSSLMEEPWLIEAAARGRAVYLRACQLAEELGLPLSIDLLDRAAEDAPA